MRTLSALLMTMLLAACATAPPPILWRAEPLLAALPTDCTGSANQAEAFMSGGIPSGLAVVRSEGRDMILVAARSCVWAVDAASGQAEALPTRGDSIAPTMLDASRNGLVFSSTLSGSVRVIDTAGGVVLNISGLRRPLGTRLLPGGSVLVAEYDTGRILGLGPSDESRPRLIAEGLDGPTGLVVADATRGYVTESPGGRVTMFSLGQFGKRTIAEGLQQPEGIALLPDGRLAVAEVGARRLLAIDPASGAREILADDLPIGSEDRFSITDVATMSSGVVLMSAAAGRTVLALTNPAATGRPPASGGR